VEEARCVRVADLIDTPSSAAARAGDLSPDRKPAPPP